MMCLHQYQQELQRRPLPTLWEVPDDMWKWIRYLFPPEKPLGTPGRPVVPFRTVLNGILYVLRTGCQWKVAPRTYGSGSTLHRRFQEWQQAGIIRAILQHMLQRYDRRRGIDWEWQAADTKLLPAPLGGTATGPNPTDRAKCGTKRHSQDDRPGIGEPIEPPRRWKVERTISWLNNMRKLRIRWEKKAENYQALVMLASALILYRLIVLG